MKERMPGGGGDPPLAGIVGNIVSREGKKYQKSASRACHKGKRKAWAWRKCSVGVGFMSLPG